MVKSKLSNKQQLLLMLFPLVLFTLVENWGGLTWALVLSVIYAVGEMGWEYWRFRQVSKMTFISNFMIVGLSLVSYLTQDGLWFKLQPAILEFFFGISLIISYLFKKPLLILMMKSQNPQLINEVLISFLNGLTFRMGLFFLLQAALAVYASYYWSTEVWAFLKSIGLFLMMVVYMLIEVLFFKIRQSNSTK